MNNLLFIATLLLIASSFLIFVGYIFSNNEFSQRNEWMVYHAGRIDWRKVDASKFMFFVLVRTWFASFALFIIAYMGVKYV